MAERTVYIAEGKTYVDRQDGSDHVVVLRIEVLATIGANWGESTQVSYTPIAGKSALGIKTMPALQFALNYRELE